MKVRCSVRKVYCQPVLTGWFGKCYVISVCLVQFNSSYQLHCHPHQRQVSFLLSLPTTAMNYYPRHPINPFYVFNIYYRFQSVVSHAGIASNSVFYPHFSYWNFLFFLSSTVSLQLHLIGHLLYTQPCSLISFYARDYSYRLLCKRWNQMSRKNGENWGGPPKRFQYWGC